MYLPEFLKQWLDPRLTKKIEIKPVKFNGVGDYLANFAERARRDSESAQVTAILGVIDFYGSGLPYPGGNLEAKYQWAKSHLEHMVGRSNFRQHFAVHETEAWLLSEPRIFPAEISDNLPRTDTPETINDQAPPSQRLKHLYHRKLNKKYKKPVEGSSLFRKLDVDVAYARCPHLKLLLDDALSLARSAAG